MNHKLRELYLTKVHGEDVGDGEHPIVTRVNLKREYIGGPGEGEEHDSYDRTNAIIITKLVGGDLKIMVRTHDMLHELTVPFNAVRDGVVNAAQKYTWSDVHKAYVGEGMMNESHDETDVSDAEEREEVKIGQEILDAMIIGHSKSAVDALRKIRPLAQRLVKMHGQEPKKVEAPVTEVPVGEALGAQPPQYVLYGNKTGQIYGVSSKNSIQFAYEELMPKIHALVKDMDDPLALNPKVVKGDGFYAIGVPTTDERAFGLIDLRSQNPEVVSEIEKRGLGNKLKFYRG